MTVTLLTLVLAALLEVGGDAAIRHGLLNSRGLSLVAGAGALVGYGLVVKSNRTIHFGRLRGVYIAIFFLVSQAIGVGLFAERPSATTLFGGALITAGGVVLQLGAR